MVALSLVVGFWLVYRLVNPWVGSVADIRRLDRDGPSYYRADTRSTMLNSHVRSVCAQFRRRRYREALAHARLGQSADAGNPLFDYLAACATAGQGHLNSALALIDKGNAKGRMRLYADARSSPDQWRWPEMVVIGYMGRRVLSERSHDRSALASVLLMAHKMAWADPPDPNRLIQALALRHSAARLLEEAAEDHDRSLAELCRVLMDETRQVQFAVRRHLMEGKTEPAKESRAWILARAAGRRSAVSPELLALYVLEKQAEWGDQLRRDYLRVRQIKGLGSFGQTRNRGT